MCIYIYIYIYIYVYTYIYIERESSFFGVWGSGRFGVDASG